jgi:hypothetical protein
MSQPTKWTPGCNVLQLISFELAGAVSSLNMLPQPILNPTGEYLCDRDHWAQHAVEHIMAASDAAISHQHYVIPSESVPSNCICTACKLKRGDP